MPMLEGKVDAVIGVDTHRDRHTAAILDPNGGLVAQLELPSDQAGAEALLSVVTERAPSRRCWALEAPAAMAPAWPASWPPRVSGWSRSTGPSGPAAGAAPRATCWTPSEPAGRP